MDKKFNVNFCSLVYEGKTVGTRLFLINNIGENTILDMNINIVHTIVNKLQNSKEFCFNKQLSDLTGRLNKDGTALVFRNDYLVTEVESVKEFDSIVRGFLKTASVHEEFKKNFRDIVKVDILDKLKAMRVQLPSRGDYNYDEDKLEYSCRFLGGFREWSGGGSDICDADTISTFLEFTLDNICEEFDKKYKDVSLCYLVGEKAWIYFYIRKSE